MPELQLRDVHFRVYRGEDLQATGHAASLNYRRDSTDLVAHDVLALLHRGPTPVQVTAPVGTGTVSDRRFTATGGVVVSRGTDVARTLSARYEPAPEGGLSAGQVIGEDPLVVEGRGYTLTGPGFTLDPATGDLAIQGGARLVAGLPVSEVRR